MDFIELESVTSTNTWAKDHLRELKPNPILCITASEQTSGRGRMARSWISPRDQNLYATFVFYLPAKTPKHNLCQLISLSCVTVLKNLGFTPAIKWPNDILLNGKKCAGVLCEIVDQAAILGLGLNINMTCEQCQAIDQPATSLLVEKNQEFSITALRNDIAKEFTRDLKLFLKEGFEPFCERYNQRLARRGEQITVGHQTGKLLGACPDGRLEVETEDGIIKTADYTEN